MAVVGVPPVLYGMFEIPKGFYVYNKFQPLRREIPKGFYVKTCDSKHKIPSGFRQFSGSIPINIHSLREFQTFRTVVASRQQRQKRRVASSLFVEKIVCF